MHDTAVSSSQLGNHPVAEDASPARSTIIVNVRDHLRQLEGSLCMSAQKIEGIMRRAGLDIQSQPPTAGKTGVTEIKETDLQTVWATIEALGYQASEIERLADSLAALA